MSKSRVFLLMPTNKDLRPTREFGGIDLLFREDEARPSIWDGEFAREAVRRLEAKRFDPDKDYLVAAGNMVPLIMFFSAAHEYWVQHPPRVLYFDIIAGEYVPRRLGLYPDTR